MYKSLRSLPAHIKPNMVYMSVIVVHMSVSVVYMPVIVVFTPALGGGGKEGTQEFRVIFIYRVSLRPLWAI